MDETCVRVKAMRLQVKLERLLQVEADAGYLSNLDWANYGAKWVGSPASSHFDTGFVPTVRLVTEL
jgi:hypothetical protein